MDPPAAAAASDDDDDDDLGLACKLLSAGTGLFASVREVGGFAAITHCQGKGAARKKG